MSHIKFPSIESYAHVYRSQQRFDVPSSVKYGAKIKLHGTNAAVRISAKGDVVAQGRNRDIFVGEDQFGFAGFVDKNDSDWRVAATKFLTALSLQRDDVVVHGEWAGPGIQKKDAVSTLAKKYFFIFAVQVGDAMYTDPDVIEAAVPDLDNLLVLPWFIEVPNMMNFADASLCDYFASWANRQANIIGERDPFIEEIFGVEGPGEGLVFVPMAQGIDRNVYSALTFKAKCEGHGAKAGPAVVRDLVIPKGVEDFVKTFVTEARCEQAVSEGCGGIATLEKTGDFLKWIGQDVAKESGEELSEMDLEWKQVQKYVITAAKLWFRAKATAIV